MLWFLPTIRNYVLQMLPCAVIGALGFLCLLPLRKKRLAARGQRSGPCREWALFLFVMFSAGLAALTLFPDSYWAHTTPQPLEFSMGKFYWTITLWEEFSGGDGWRFFLFLGNLIMFAPFGFFPALAGEKPHWWKALLTGFCVSSLIEFVQLFIQRGSDINDIILNTSGALCGFWLYLLLKRIAPRLTARFKLQKTEVPHGRKTRDTTAPSGAE